MDAVEAAELTKAACSCGDDRFDEIMMHVETRIREAAQKGLREMHHPFHGLTSLKAGRHLPTYPTDGTKDAIRVELENRGFKWTHHPRPEGTNDPREQAYDTVQW